MLPFARANAMLSITPILQASTTPASMTPSTMQPTFSKRRTSRSRPHQTSKAMRPMYPWSTRLSIYARMRRAAPVTMVRRDLSPNITSPYSASTKATFVSMWKGNRPAAVVLSMISHATQSETQKAYSSSCASLVSETRLSCRRCSACPIASASPRSSRSCAAACHQRAGRTSHHALPGTSRPPARRR